MEANKIDEERKLTNDALPKINRIDLIKARKYLWVYLPLFITDDMLYNHREIMPKLNSSRQTFLTFYLFDCSMCTSGSNYDPDNPDKIRSIIKCQIKNKKYFSGLAFPDRPVCY